MVVGEADMITHVDVVDSSVDPPHPRTDRPTEHGNGNYVLGHQSSIYSLTLDEFQHTVCEGGKSFGSMNMDEFLNSIWTAEENHAHHPPHTNNNNAPPSLLAAASSTTGGGGGGLISKQPSLPRQGSLSLPAPLCRKTVDEVWSEIQKTQHQDQQQPEQPEPEPTTQRQPTFGEMTLEDFLIKAGIVREQQCGPTATRSVEIVPPPQPQPQPQPQPPTQHHSQYGFPQMGPSFVGRPMMPAYQPMPVIGGETSGYAGGVKRNNGYPNPSGVAGYGGRLSNGVPGGGGFGAGLSPVSPVSPDRICGPGQVDNSSGQYGMEMAVLRGRKRIIDGPVEKVVERRQRRMIKNRESAARSRARKQAYTVELEAELNQLREENAQLKEALMEIERQRKQQKMEEEELAALSKAQRAQEKLKTMRRSNSC